MFKLKCLAQLTIKKKKKNQWKLQLLHKNKKHEIKYSLTETSIKCHLTYKSNYKNYTIKL